MSSRRPVMAAPVVIGVVDAEWRVRRISGEIHALLGYHPDEILGSGIFANVHPEDVSELLIHLAQAVETGGSAKLDLRLWHKADGWARTSVFAASLAPGDPFPFGFVATSAEPRPHTADQARLAGLELRMRRIAAEIEAAGVGRVSVGRVGRSLDDAQLDSLSPRQREITRMLASGHRVVTIARELGISQSTVRNHLSLIFRKVGVGSQAELVEVVTAEDRRKQPDPAAR